MGTGTLTREPPPWPSQVHLQSSWNLDLRFETGCEHHKPGLSPPGTTSPDVSFAVSRSYSWSVSLCLSSEAFCSSRLPLHIRACYLLGLREAKASAVPGFY